MPGFLCIPAGFVILFRSALNAGLARSLELTVKENPLELRAFASQALGAEKYARAYFRIVAFFD